MQTKLKYRALQLQIQHYHRITIQQKITGQDYNTNTISQKDLIPYTRKITFQDYNTNTISEKDYNTNLITRLQIQIQYYNMVTNTYGRISSDRTKADFDVIILFFLRILFADLKVAQNKNNDCFRKFMYMQIYRCLHIDDASQSGLLRASYIRPIFKKCYSCMANFEANFPQFELKFINQVIGMMPRIISNADTVIFCHKSGKSNRGRCQRHLCLNVELQQNVADSPPNQSETHQS